MSDHPTEPELAAQLRALGEHAQRAVPQTSANDVIIRASAATSIDVHESAGQHESPAGLGAQAMSTAQTGRVASSRQPQQPRGDRSWRSRRFALAIGGAALAACIMGIVALRGASTADIPVEVASAQQPERSGAYQIPDNDNGWASTRFCESTNDYTIDAGNSFYGAYQFATSQWRAALEAVGLDRYRTTSPAAAPPEIQDAAANSLFLLRGAEAWPVCGRYLDGPQVTPVIPQWLGHPTLDDTRTIIFLAPDTGRDRIGAIANEIAAVVGDDMPSTMALVDQAEAFAEFQQMFADDEPMRDLVDIVDMPPSYRLDVELTTATRDRLRSIPGVFEVIESSLHPLGVGPTDRHLSIPAIDLAVGVHNSVTIEELADGPGVLSSNVSWLAIAGYGSVDGSVFDGLTDLVTGDRITVTTRIVSNDIDYEIVRTYAVATPPQTVEVQEAAVPDAAPATSSGGSEDGAPAQHLFLVADVPDDPLQRVIVEAHAVDPDSDKYASSPG